MKIISKFRDYYDHIGYLYGVDPSVVYLRNCIETPAIADEYTNSFFIASKNCPKNYHEFHYRLFNTPECNLYTYAWLVVLNKAHLLIKRSQSHKQYTLADNKRWEIFDPTKHNDLYNSLFASNSSLSYKQKTVSYYQCHEAQYYIDLGIKIENPVFTIAYVRRGSRMRDWGIEINKAIPNLSTVGYSSIVPPQQIYQQLCHHFTNVLRENADTIPPVTIRNKDKIEGKGFDYKTSFRH